MNVSAPVKNWLVSTVIPLAQVFDRVIPALQRLWSFARLRTQVGTLDPTAVVLGMPELHGTRNIRLGSNLYLYRDLYMETRETGSIRIGDDVVLSRGVHLVAYAGIEIGAGSMIGEYTSVRDANHRHGKDLAPRHSGYDAKPIRIGRNVWIGRGVTILPGVSVGDGAVVGANAVVTHDIPAGIVAAGIPARHLNERGSP